MNPLRSKRRVYPCDPDGRAGSHIFTAFWGRRKSASLRGGVLSLVLALGSAPYAAPATAQTSAPDQPAAQPTAGATSPIQAPPSATDLELAAKYEHAIAQAVDEHERGNFAEAREHFREAHALEPSARTLRGLGMVEFELRNYGESVHFLEAALASETKTLPPDLHEEVARLLERARAYVGEIHVDVQPGSASVSVDGVSVASGPQASLSLQIGSHLLEFRADGRRPERRFVTVRGREQINIQVVLNPLENEHALQAIASQQVAHQDSLRRKAWIWTAAGAVVVAAAVGIGVAVRNKNHEPSAPYGGSTGFALRNP
jgi:tetratricopeptide (TPR) repeat protein